MTGIESSSKRDRYTDLFDLFVFDLDGTLVETREDIASSLNHALFTLGCPALDVPTVTRFIGNGAPLLLRRALGAFGENPDDGKHGGARDRGHDGDHKDHGDHDGRVEEGLRVFLEHYSTHCIDRASLYPGVEAVLAQLKASGKELAVLTNKPRDMSVTILNHLGISGRFARIHGGDTFPARKPDPGGIRNLMTDLSFGRSRTLFIGDSAVDVATARAADVAAAGVLWGFKPEELLADPPQYLLEKIVELLGPVGDSSPH